MATNSDNRRDEGLQALGAMTKYRDVYAPEVLETFINKHQGNDYWVRFNCPEFTSLCPITGQPDFAEIRICYIPDVRLLISCLLFPLVLIVSIYINQPVD